MTITLMAAMASLAIPAWRLVTGSHSRDAALDTIMASIDRARSQALTMRQEVWVVLAHPGGRERDALRLVTKESDHASPFGPWLKLPAGITFHLGGSTLMEQSPPPEILLAACHGTPAGQDGVYGGLLFRGSERIALPRQGGNQLSLQLDSASGSTPVFVMLSRATGRALCR